MLKAARTLIVRFAAVPLLLLLAAAAASAQGLNLSLPAPANPLLGGVPVGTATSTPITLKVGEIISRALEHNLAVLNAEQGIERASGTRRAALSALLPNVDARVTEQRQKTNLEAFGFPLGPGFPRVVGPFNVFDARVFLSQPVLDLRALNDTRAEGHRVEAAKLGYRSDRDLVVLVAARLFLDVVASQARADSARAQLETATALFQQAQSLRQNGIVAGIDVVRAEVRMSTEQQRVTSTENDFQKAKLQLARVIGLPVGQPFNVDPTIPDLPGPQMNFDEALAAAYKSRPDYLAALERVKAAEAARSAALAEQLPSVNVTANYGTIGLTVGSALPTFNVTGAVSIPIFEGGRAQAHAAQADADLKQRQAEAEDLRAGVYYDVQSSFLDLQAISERLRTATRARELANQQLTQARDRFGAGVADNLEVIQGQEALALASEQYISALYGFNLSKATLALAIGDAEAAVRRYLGIGSGN